MKFITTFLSALSLAAVTALPSQADNTKVIKIYDAVTFYDGYASVSNNPDLESGDGILRHENSLYAVRLTDDVLDSFGKTVDMDIHIKACCDNYDRIGNINIALVPKGEETYNPFETQRLELGRFITPFMNMNKQPDTVPYHYWMDYLSPIMHDAALREKYDIWMEFELFGIPYAANQQIKGCADRNDVFLGTLEFYTDDTPVANDFNNVLVPIVMKKPEHRGKNLNNYQEGCTDQIGLCVKTWEFEVPEDCEDAQIVLVTSNHGANSGGEEYNRRRHMVYFDDENLLTYIPGRESCEPFRQYNTQANGIYGMSKKSDAAWQSFSNWCPGDVIDNRIIRLGSVEKGTHKVKVRVIATEFPEKQGDIPVSMFFQGVKKGALPEVNGVKGVEAERNFRSSVSVNDKIIHVNAGEGVSFVEIYNAEGVLLHDARTTDSIDMSHADAGLYLLNIEYPDGLNETHKIILR